jgi:hypothetical protein
MGNMLLLQVNKSNMCNHLTNIYRDN